jgi:hypothetical protein
LADDADQIEVGYLIRFGPHLRAIATVAASHADAAGLTVNLFVGAPVKTGDRLCLETAIADEDIDIRPRRFLNELGDQVGKHDGRRVLVATTNFTLASARLWIV